MAQPNRIQASYLITTKGDPGKIATEIAFEQTVEMPGYLISDPRILEKIVGQISEIHVEGEDQYRVILEYSPDILNGSLNQLMNLIFGNISLKKGIRLVDLAFPPDFLQKFPGPAYGVSGLRSRMEVFGRPLTCTALKPLGCSAPELARMCYELALGGIDIIKDDHNLGNQLTCTYQDRVRLCRQALLKAQEKSGRRSLYFTNINDSPGVMQQQIEYALELGVDGFLLQPVVAGLDFFRSIAENQSYPFFLIAHPSLSGVFFTSSKEGIAPEILLGTLFRMAGADAVIFPDYSGRFSSFNEDICRKISTNLLAPLGTMLPSFPIPAGGLTLSNLPEVRKNYPEDTIFLIGAGLYGSGPSLQENVKRFLDQLLSSELPPVSSSGPSQTTIGTGSSE